MMWLREFDHWFIDHILPYERQYLKLARRLTGDFDEAADLVHDAYARVFSHDGVRQAANPRAYVLQIVRNLGIQRIRRARIVSIENVAAVEDLQQADLAVDAFGQLSDRDELRRVIVAVQKLPPQARRVVIMRRFDEMSPKAVAERLGISVSTMEKHLAKGLSLLAEMLDAAEMAEESAPGERETGWSRRTKSTTRR
jgi:RNA polymerase sigma factor (sigma-70 family)